MGAGVATEAAPRRHQRGFAVSEVPAGELGAVSGVDSSSRSPVGSSSSYDPAAPSSSTATAEPAAAAFRAERPLSFAGFREPARYPSRDAPFGMLRSRVMRKTTPSPTPMSVPSTFVSGTSGPEPTSATVRQSVPLVVSPTATSAALASSALAARPAVCPATVCSPPSTVGDRRTKAMPCSTSVFVGSSPLCDARFPASSAMIRSSEDTPGELCTIVDRPSSVSPWPRMTTAVMVPSSPGVITRVPRRGAVCVAAVT